MSTIVRAPPPPLRLSSEFLTFLYHEGPTAASFSQLRDSARPSPNPRAVSLGDALGPLFSAIPPRQNRYLTNKPPLLPFPGDLTSMPPRPRFSLRRGGHRRTVQHFFP